MTPNEIFALRTRLGMSQAELADRLNTTVTTVSRWERGVCDPLDVFVERMRALEATFLATDKT